MGLSYTEPLYIALGSDSQDDDLVERIAKALRLTESNENYKAVSPDEGYGAYQFMPKTWDRWTSEYTQEKYGESTSLDITDPKNQDEVAKWQIRKLVNEGYTPQQIASIWNSGSPDWEGKRGKNKWGVRYDVPKHVQRFTEHYNNLSEPASATPKTDTPSLSEYAMRLLSPTATHAADIPKPVSVEFGEPTPLSIEIGEPAPINIELGEPEPYSYPEISFGDPVDIGDTQPLPLNAMAEEASGMAYPISTATKIRKPIPMGLFDPTVESALLSDVQSMGVTDQQYRDFIAAEPDDIVFKGLKKVFGGEYHPGGALLSTAGQLVESVFKLPYYLAETLIPHPVITDIAAVGKRDVTGTIQSALAKTPAADFAKAVSEEREAWLSEALGSLGVTIGSLGLSQVPVIGPALAASYYFFTSKDDVTQKAVEKIQQREGRAPTPDEYERITGVSSVVGGVNSVLQMMALDKIFPTIKQGLGNVVTNWLTKGTADTAVKTSLDAVQRKAVGFFGMLGTAMTYEGGQEGIEGVLGYIGSRYAAKPPTVTESEFWSGIFADESRKEMLEVFVHDAAIGALSAGMIGGAGQTYQATNQARLNYKAYQARRKFVDYFDQKLQEAVESNLASADPVANEPITPETQAEIINRLQGTHVGEEIIDIDAGVVYDRVLADTERRVETTPGDHISSVEFTPDTQVTGKHKVSDIIQAVDYQDMAGLAQIMSDVYHAGGTVAVQDWFNPLKIFAYYTRLMTNQGVPIKDSLALVKPFLGRWEPVYTQTLESLRSDVVENAADAVTVGQIESKMYDLIRNKAADPDTVRVLTDKLLAAKVMTKQQVDDFALTVEFLQEAIDVWQNMPDVFASKDPPLPILPVDLDVIINSINEISGNYPLGARFIRDVKTRKPALGVRGLFWVKPPPAKLGGPLIELGTTTAMAPKMNPKTGLPDGYVFEQSFEDPDAYKRTASHEFGHMWHTLYPDMLRLIRDNKTIAREMFVHTMMWRKFDVHFSEDGIKYMAYRAGLPELAADAFSAYMTNSAYLQATAPTFTAAFTALIDSNPQARRMFERIQQLQRDEAELFKAQTENMEKDWGRVTTAVLKAKYDTEKKATFKAVFDDIATAFFDKNHRLYSIINKLVKNPLSEPTVKRMGENVRLMLEDYSYRLADIQRYMFGITDILQTAMKEKLPPALIEQLMFADHIRLEDVNRPNPYLANAQGAEKFLRSFKQYVNDKAGPGAFDRLGELRDKLADLRQKYVINYAEASGIFDPRIIAAAKRNKNYMRHRVLKYLIKTLDYAGTETSKIVHPRYGTYHELASPLIFTILQDVTILNTARQAITAKALSEFLTLAAPEEIFPAGLSKVPPKGFEAITYLQNSKKQKIYVQKDMALWANTSPNDVHHILKAVYATQSFIKQALVSKNPIWMTRNLFRDVQDSFSRMPGYDLATLLAKYAEAKPEITAMIRDGVLSPDIEEAIAVHGVIPNMRLWSPNDAELVPELDEQYVFKLLAMYGATGTEAQAEKNILKLIGGKLEYLGELTEKLPKIAGYKYLKAKPKAMATILGKNVTDIRLDANGRVDYAQLTEEERMRVGHALRNYFGTPDPMQGGTWKPFYNSVLLFSNIGKQGVRAAVEVAAQRPAEFWLKTSIKLMPKLMLTLAGLGAFGDDLKRWADGISTYVKANYTVIPVPPFIHNNRSLGLRIPMAYHEQFLSNLLYRGIMAVANMATGDPQYTAGKPGEIFRSVVEQMPYTGVNPLLQIASDIATYVYGQMPQDDYRGTDAFNRQIFEAGGFRSHKEFLKYLSNQVFSGFWKFKQDTLQRETDPLDSLLQMPGVRQTIGPFLFSSEQGTSEQTMAVADKYRQAYAKRQLAVNDRIYEDIYAIRERKQTPSEYNAMRLYQTLRREGLLDANVKDYHFKHRYMRYVIKQKNNTLFNALVYATTNEEKVEQLNHIYKRLDTIEFQGFLRDARREGLITQDLMRLWYRNRR